jgi:hypothetical protein
LPPLNCKKWTRYSDHVRIRSIANHPTVCLHALANCLSIHIAENWGSGFTRSYRTNNTARRMQ